MIDLMHEICLPGNCKLRYILLKIDCCAIYLSKEYPEFIAMSTMSAQDPLRHTRQSDLGSEGYFKTQS